MSLEKRSSTLDFNFNEIPVQIVTDQRGLTKRSADESFKVAADKKNKDQTDLHVIALGSYDGYGCFFEGATVNTKEGFKEIQSLRVGDTVLTHTGSYNKITQVFSKDYKDEIKIIDVVGCPESISCTLGHPFYVIRDKDFTTNDRCFSVTGKTSVDQTAVLPRAQWVKACDLVEGDYVLSPTYAAEAVNDSTDFDDDDAYLMGYYLSEGCMWFDTREDRNWTPRGVVYTLNTEGDKPIVAKLQEIFSRKGWTFEIKPQESSDKGIRISLNNSDYARKLYPLFGHLASKKFIHPIIFRQNDKWLKTMIGAYLDGDGCVISRSNNIKADKYVNTLTANSSGLSLISDLQRLFARLGIPSSITKGWNKHKNGCFGGRDHVIYSIAIGRSYSHILLDYCLRLNEDTAVARTKYKTAKTYIVGNYLVSRVSNIETQILEYPVAIYNIEVDGDNSYCVNNWAVHNSNRNLDSFSEEDCEKCHPTFLKAWGMPDGRGVCRNHKNKKTDPRYGTIKKSAYNKKMKRVELIIGLDNDKCGDEIQKIAEGKQVSFSMACFPAGTAITLANNKKKDIYDVAINDQVLTHTGNYRKVTALMRKDYTDKGVTLRAAGLPDPIVCTADHRFWARPTFKKDMPCPVCSEKFKNLKAHLWQKTDAQHIAAKQNLTKEFDSWISAEYLGIGDFVVTPFNTLVTEQGDETYAAILGWYLSEGHFYESENVRESNHCLDFTLNINEITFADEITQLLLLYGVQAKDITRYTYPKTHKLVVRCRDLTLGKKLTVDGGKYCHGKAIHPSILTWSPVVQKIILEKWLEGDGTRNKKTANLSGTTVSKQLADDMALISYRNGLSPNIYHTKAKKKKRKAYTLMFSMGETERLSVTKDISFARGVKPRIIDLGKLKPWQSGCFVTVVRQTQKQTYIEGNLVYRRVNKIVHNLLDTVVYDLTVAEDSSFVANGLAAHNCKVDHDVCSECGHKSYNADGNIEKGIPSDRCDCIKNKLGDITKTGNIIHMLNPKPNWGELSVVGRPADRIAYSIKAAHDIGIAPKLAFINDEPEPSLDHLRVSKKASDKLSLVSKLAAMEKRLAAVGVKANKESLARISADREDLSKETIEELRSIEPDKLLKVLADNGIIFKPSEFMSYLFDNKVKQHHVDGMKSHLSDIFSETEKKRGGEVVNNDRFNPSDFGSVMHSVMQLVSKLKESHSFQDGPSARRVMQITIIKGPTVKKANVLEKTTSVYDLKLAEQYCAYKLAALNYLDEQGKLDDSIMLNSVWQNRL